MLRERPADVLSYVSTTPMLKQNKTDFSLKRGTLNLDMEIRSFDLGKSEQNIK